MSSSSFIYLFCNFGIMTELSYPNNLLITNDKCRKYSCSGRSIFVHDDTNLLTLLSEHQYLPNGNQSQVYLSLKVTKINSDFNNKVYVPLIPGYAVFTYIGGYYFYLKLGWYSIHHVIMYQWSDYGSDPNFTQVIATQSEPDQLSSLQQYLETNSDIRYDAEEISNEFHTQVSELSNKNLIVKGLLIHPKGWKVSLQISQVMALQLRLSQSNYQNITKCLCRSQKKVKQLQEQLQENSDCSDNSDDDSDAKQCHTVTIFTNEFTEMNFSRVVAGAGLLEGINHEEWRNMLAFCGITKQSGKRQYFEHQDIMLKDIVQVAHQSADEALTAALNFIKKQLKKKEEYILEGSFDWL
ncbi:294_t:CDS:2 [Funneliformis geosporum]|nr:294_t:CDS:2 [Funneliformis geosporum]